jgi:uncharacterized protein (DUF362 family)/ferredoxin
MTCPVYYSRVSSYDESLLRDSLHKLLVSAAGGYGSLKGKKILRKPNLLFCRRSDDPAAVHPAVITAAAEVLLNAGAAEVTLLENPGTQHVSAIIEKMQISEKLHSLNVRYDDFADYRELALPGNCCFRQLRIAREFENFDLVVDLAKAKTHAMMTLTLAVKNLFGFIDSADRLSWHLAVGSDFNRFADLLLDLYLTVKPQISIIDGIIGMEGNGPGSGTPVAANFLACSADALALDASVAERLGVASSELILLQRAAKRGLDFSYSNQGEIPETVPFKLPDPPGMLNAWGVTLPPFFKKQLRNLAGSRPFLDAKECISCGRCAEVCPPQSLKMKMVKKRKLPFFDLNNCIRCYCCQEHCPRGAISPRPQLLNSLLSAAVRIFRRR